MYLLPLHATVPEVFIGIGSNIEPQKNMKECARLLAVAWPTISFSSVYKTAPVGFTDQDFFLNAVARIETDNSPQEIINSLREIEATLHKSIPYKDGPRTIDLDLLLYGDISLDEEDLTVPHMSMHARRFVLEPLCELITAEKLHPVLKQPFLKLLEGVQKQECTQSDLRLSASE